MPEGDAKVADSIAADARPAQAPAPATTSGLDTLSRLIQVVSVVVRVVISVLSYSATQQKEAGAREAEARAREIEMRRYYDQRRDEVERRQTEAARPFLELRQKRYMEIVRIAAALANPEDHTAREIASARRRFRELYVTELSLVEGYGVAESMVRLAEQVDPKLTAFTPKQEAAYNLAHALRDSLVKSWNLDEKVVDRSSPQADPTQGRE
jgi:hypothetical protein